MNKDLPGKGFIITEHYYKDVLDIAGMKKLIKNGIMTSIANDTDLIEKEYLSRKS